MKKKLIPMALMALAMGFTACSSDDTTANGSNGKPSFAEGGYVKMAINLPSTSAPVLPMTISTTVSPKSTR